MVFENGAYCTIWKVFKVNEKGTSIKANIRISQKQGDGYVTRYQGIVYFCNDSKWDDGQRIVVPTVNKLLGIVAEARTRDVSFDDEDYPKNMAPHIKILHCGCSRTWDAENKQERRFDFVYDFEVPQSNKKGEQPAPAQKKPMKQNGSFVDLPKSDLDEELPFV